MCILEAFQNQQSMLLADKVLKQLGKEKAKEKYKVFVHILGFQFSFPFYLLVKPFFFSFPKHLSCRTVSR